MHSGQKTTRPRDNSSLFINTFLSPRTRHFHRNRRPLARSPFFLGISLHFDSLVLFSPPSFRRHRIVAQPRQWMRLHMLMLCGVDWRFRKFVLTVRRRVVGDFVRSCSTFVETARFRMFFRFFSKTACRGARVSGGDLCEAEAPTEPAGETKSFCPCKKKNTTTYLS